MVKELKKELSKLSGVDFFNPKYRDVFKKYFPNDTTESDVNDNEEDRLKEVLGEDVEETTKTSDTQENTADNNGENASEDKDGTSTEETKEGDESDNSDAKTSEDDGEESDAQDTTDTEPNADAGDSTETDTTESSEQTETTEGEDTQDTSSTVPTTEENTATDNTSQELLETKVELQLVKANVREDRLEAAKKLFMQEIHSLEDLDKLKDLIKQYPEWLKQNKPEAKPFGMPMGDNGDGLTEEEKRLKAMGIDPKS